MKASELIEYLQQAIYDHGDLEVAIPDNWEQDREELAEGVVKKDLLNGCTEHPGPFLKIWS